MSTLEFIANLAHYLSWPLAVVTVGLILRRPVAKALSERTVEAKAPGFELNVSGGLAPAIEAARQATSDDEQRAAIREIVDEAAAYGWFQSSLQKGDVRKFEPPKIEWSEDGSVKVTTADGSVPSESRGDGAWHEISYLTAMRNSQEYINRRSRR